MIKKFHLPELVFFLSVFLLSIIPLYDFDLWFHIKSGEVFWQKGLIFHDVFSYSAEGRRWFPYEWLFQVTVYLIKSLFGLESIKLFIAGITTLQIALIFFLLKKIIKLNLLLSLTFSFFYFASTYEFLSGRPHIVAYTLLLANFYLILKFFLDPKLPSLKKNYLWLTLPITYIWANFHASIFIDIAFYLSYATGSLIFFFTTKQHLWLNKFKTLLFFSVINFILTIIPPLGFTQYELLWMFFRNRNFLSSFIDEWIPLSYNAFAFSFYTATVVLIFLMAAFLIIKKKAWLKAAWLLPLLPLPFLPYTASRNIVLGYISLTMILGWTVSQLEFTNFSVLIKRLLTGLLIIFVAIHLAILIDKRKPPDIKYPTQAVEFIKQNHLSGHMFNEYGFGGYMLYNLYPDQKVFIDGRTDIYLCCEILDLLNLSKQKALPDDEYKKVLEKLWNKYEISFLVLSTPKHSVLRRITHLLTNDPNWILIFWDDTTQIIVKKDGKNDEIIKKFGATVASPYERNPYKQGQEKQALEEYQRMIQTADSAKSRNAVGFIYLKQGKFDEAKVEFEKAIELDNNNESPFMNMAEMAASVGDLQTAIRLYTEALRLAPDRGLIYIRLGELTLKYTEDINEAKKIWQQGVEKTVDDDAKAKLKEFLSGN